MRRNLTWIVIGVAAVALVALFVLLRPGGEPSTPASPAAGASSPSPTPTPSSSPEHGHEDGGEGETADGTDEATDGGTGASHEDAAVYRVRDGVVRGPAEITIAKGEVVHAWVTADVADEVHVHGFDLHFDVVPGERAHVEFEASAAGIYEVELEESGLLLFTLKVTE